MPMLRHALIALPLMLFLPVAAPASGETLGDARVGFSAETEINRKDWGLDFNVALETGGVLVGDKIKLSIDAEWVKA